MHNFYHFNGSEGIVYSDIVMVTAYDFESGRPGLIPEWVLIYY